MFAYGCENPGKQEQVFPILMRENCPAFSFRDCSFVTQKDREGTARIALWRELGVTYCYTLEVSFSGADFGKYELVHFNRGIFLEIGQAFCKSLKDLFEADIAKMSAISQEIQTRGHREEHDSDNSDYE